MDDDIDIEEHDVLDNPRIKNMFPDITTIKTELEDYNEEEASMNMEEDCHSYRPFPITFKEEDNVKPFRNKIIIGSKPSTSTFHIHETFSQGAKLEDEPEFEEPNIHGLDNQETWSQNIHGIALDNKQTWSQETDIPKTNFLQTLLENRGFQNKIILGGKPINPPSDDSSDDSFCDDDEFNLPDVSVVLEDCKNVLENNPCFCKECEILFATDNDLEAHKMVAHSFLVAVSKNKAVKSTTKHSIHCDDIDSKNLTCNHCNIVFPNTIDLLRHTYELLPGTFACDICDLVFENDAACKAHKTKHYRQQSEGTLTNSLSPATIYSVCKICSCHFKWIAKLKNHMSLNHNNNEIGNIVHEESNLQCRFCNTKLTHSRGYNTHIQNCHAELYRKRADDVETFSKFKCPQCNLCFSSDYSLRIHLAARHGHVGSVQDSKKLANIEESNIKSGIITNSPTVSDNDDTCPIPKSTLFKCNKCNVHFVSCISAILHSRLCVYAKGDFRCHQCKFTFNSSDKIYHSYQHSISDNFTVIEISNNILNRVLCKCQTCEICFDEKSFMTYHSDECDDKTPSIHCTECNQWIYAKAMPAHKKIHASGLTARDFIVIDYVHFRMNEEDELEMDTPKLEEIEVDPHTSKGTKGSLIVKHTKLAKPKGLLSTRYDQTAHYYCPTCKCFMKINRRTDKHYNGQCNTKLPTTTCKSCGLRFTQKAMMSHKKLHRKHPRLRLKDFKITNTQTNKRINPPFPTFKICRVCKVNFFGSGALKNHACNAEESRVCPYCTNKFSDLAYNLHIQFHEYSAKTETNKDRNDKVATIKENIPELLKKYESLQQVWNILFLCQTCDVVSDTYDRVVEHCQDHFCNMESYNVTIEHCHICDLNFVDECFEKHTELHSSYDFNKDSFKIIEYKYENLLTNNWLDIFGSLTNEQVDLILSKSMYKFTRGVRMKVLSNGPSNLTLYQCGKCNVIVAPNRVTEHSQNLNNTCGNTRPFNCSICRLKFAYKSYKIIHENLHEVRKIDVKSFRIIQFNAEKQFLVTEVEHNDTDVVEDKQSKDPEGLKFIRCQHCGKLINKQKYKIHVQYHNYYDKNKIKTTSPTYVHNYYKCKDCEVCVSKKNIKEHNCKANNCKKKCPKCSLWFRSQNLASHYKFHMNHTFNRNNINIIHFRKGVILKKCDNKKVFVESNKICSKLLTFYQCVKCATCICVKSNINRHVCMPPSYRVTCKICGINLISARKDAHDKMHEDRKFNSKNIRIIQFKGKKLYNTESTNSVALKRKPLPTYEETVAKKPRIDQTLNKNKEDTGYEGHKRTVPKRRRISNTIAGDLSDRTLIQSLQDSRCYPLMHYKYYKCKTCELFFVTATKLIEHEKVCDKNREAVKCNICALPFHASQIASHKKLQKCSNNMNSKVYVIKIRQIGKSYNVASNWIYLCVRCQTHNISFDGLHHHVKVNHQTKYAIKTCELCNIKFTSSSHTCHQRIHHSKKKTVISDLSIAEVEDMTMEKALNDLPNYKDVDNFDDTLNPPDLTLESATIDYVDNENDSESPTNTSNKLSKRPKTEFNESGIYNCKVCNLNFVHPNSLDRHLQLDKHKEVHRSCPKCKLSFTSISLKKHLIVHHNKKTQRPNVNTKTNDSIVESISKIFEIQPNASSFQHESISESGNVQNDTSSEVDTITEKGEANKPEEGTSNLDRDETVSRNDVDYNNRPSINIENTVGNDTALNKNKLFKCSVCNVYFLTANDCVEHMRPHAQLDTTEYIACKICDLQFCCEFLGRHMKSHREKTFCVDDLIIVEYRSNADGGDLVTDTYLAMDRLKTKLVSTTTHFDTEDDKSVCVDSTTSENIM